MSKPRPIAITDEQLSQIMRSLEPLQPHERSALLAKLAEHLRARPGEIGDGQLFRLLRELVRGVWRPPEGVRHDTPANHHRRVGEPIR